MESIISSDPAKKASRRACAVPSCTLELRRTGNDVTLHTFPKSKKKLALRNQWIQTIRILKGDANWEPGDKVICSRHILPSAVEYKESGKCLLETAFLTENLGVHASTSLTDQAQETLTDAQQPTTSPPPASEVQSESNFQPDFFHNSISCPSCHVSITVTSGIDGCISAVGLEDIQTSNNSEPKRRRIEGTSRKNLFPASVENTASASSEDTSQPTSIQITPRSRKLVRREHSYCASPGQAADELKVVKKELAELKYQHKLLQEKIQRRDENKTTMKDQLAQLQTLSKDQIQSLEGRFPELLKSIITNEKQAVTIKGKSGMVYDDHIKKFAATLIFYSPRAYRFLREYLTLPHPNTISSWMRSSNSGPGFNLEVIERLAEVRSKCPKEMTDVAVMIDEMAIRKELVWNPSKHKFEGHINYGNEIPDSVDIDLPLASSVLVCMISGLTGGWKSVIGYIFTDKVDSGVQKSFVDKAFHLLNEAKFNVHALISDGNTANVAMYDVYGVVERAQNKNELLTYADLDPSFPNPADPTKFCTAVYDACHMEKLCRSFVAECEEITLKDGRNVSWSYVKNLYTLQTEECIRAANKLGRYHIDYQNHKMNVKLAVQTLSKSTADAITFCREDLKLPEFQGSEGTTYFFFLSDKVFDILNSRNPCQKGHKSPIKKQTLAYQTAILEEFCEQVLSMTYTETRTYKKTGKVTRVVKLVVQSARKRGILGMVMTIKSILAVSVHLLYREVNPFNYVMTYRFSQDLLELHFNKVRGRLGRNDNPNTVQFQQIMNTCWHQNSLKSSNTGNCIEQMPDGIIPGGLLPLKSRPRLRPFEQEEIGDSQVIDIAGLNQPEFSEFYQNCLGYISGNVVRVVGTRLTCETCCEALLNCDEDPLPENVKLLITRKDRGGLFVPCASVFKLVKNADLVFRELVKISKGTLRIENLDKKIVQSVLNKCIETPVFPHLREHIVDFDPNMASSHLTKLIRDIVTHFLRIRLFDYGNRYQKFKEISIRHKLTKTTLFRNQ